ncbi:MAG: MFS transporter, partial [Candidatus Adiutrix sp.]|nr:MFS transporter [Candidatus Adiutrix sp.]
RPTAEVKRAIKQILGFKAIWFLGIFHGLSYGSLNNLGNWLPSMLADLDGGQAADWAGAAVAVLLLGAFGRAFGGRLLGWWSRGRGVTLAVLAILILYLIMGLAGQKYALLGGAMLMALACGSTYGGVFTLSASAGAAYAATAMGVMNTIGNLVNVGLTLVFGYVRQYTGEFSLSLIAVSVLGMVCWLAGRKLILEMDERSRP